MLVLYNCLKKDKQIIEGNYEEEEDNNRSDYSSSRASEYENYERTGNSPSDFAEAMVRILLMLLSPSNRDF